MDSPQRKLFSQKAQSLLGQFDATAETVTFVAKDGPLTGPFYRTLSGDSLVRQTFPAQPLRFRIVHGRLHH
jgi:hypothetical protein